MASPTSAPCRLRSEFRELHAEIIDPTTGPTWSDPPLQLTCMNVSRPRARRDPTTSARDRARASLVLLIVGSACCLLFACAGKPPPPAEQHRCPPNRPGCQIEIVFADVGLGERVARMQGHLSADQPGISYVFAGRAGETLRLKFSGPAARLVLTWPDGRLDGRGLPAELLLGAKGNYALRVSGDTMADNAYGEFQLELRLTRAP